MCICYMYIFPIHDGVVLHDCQAGPGPEEGAVSLIMKNNSNNSI